ncbi:MAG: TAXI family TRAP transporter solute-binding subunit [Rhodospirillaceae bacterium]
MPVLRLAAAAVFSLAAAAPAAAQVFSIGTNPQGSLMYSTGTAISKVMAQKAGKQYRVAPYGGSSTYVPLVNKAELEFGVANSGELSFAYTSTGTFESGPKFSNLRMVASLVPTLSGFIVRTESGMKKVADLKGKRLPTEYTAGRIFYYISESNLATVGYSAKQAPTQVPVPNFNEAVEALISGRADAAYVGLNAGVSQKAMASIRGGIRMLTLENTPDAQKKIADSFPSGRISPVRPAKENIGVVDEPTWLFTVDFFLFTHDKLPDEVAYEVAKTLHANKEELAKVHPAMEEFSPANMAMKTVVPFHPGAQKFYSEKGM